MAVCIRMTNSRHKRSAEIEDSIRQILYRDWNPIGVPDLPADEYDSYIAPVYRILTGTRSEEELVEFLFRTACDTIGVACETQEHFEALRPVARSLLDLNVSL